MTTPTPSMRQALEWISADERMPEWACRDDTPCQIQGRPIGALLQSETVLVALDGGGVRTDHAETIEDSGTVFWATYGKRVTHWQPLPAIPGAPGEQPPKEAPYVECRECSECGHIGINDSHESDAACGYSCGWTGPSPKEDKCPGCARENIMSASCPKCSGHYRFLADTRITAPQQPAQGQDAKDAAMLDWMAEHGAYVTWNRDREACRVFVPDDVGDYRPAGGWSADNYDTAREAISAAMQKQESNNG